MQGNLTMGAALLIYIIKPFGLNNNESGIIGFAFNIFGVLGTAIIYYNSNKWNNY